MAKIGLPVIDIVFQQKAVSAIDRSERGIACVIIQDDTAVEGVELYRYLTDIPEDRYDAENLEAIKRCFLTEVNRVYVVAVGLTSTLSTAVNLIEGLRYNYVCTTVESWQQDLVSFVINKNMKAKGKKYVGVISDAAVADSQYIINVKNSTVHDAVSGEIIPTAKYLPRLTAVLANLPMNRSCTYYELEDLSAVDESFVSADNDLDSWINKGYLVLFKDEDVVKIARGVNSLTTFTSTNTEDMRKIIIMESLNLILEDIYTTFKEAYVGKYKNSYDNQCLFISAVNSYFRQLAREEILDPSYENVAYVDVEAQREAWLSIGKTEAADWKEQEVKNMTFKSTIFLAGQIKVLDAIEDLKFTITMA